MKLGLLFMRLKLTTAAKEQFQWARKIQKGRVASHPQDVAYRQDEARTCILLTTLLTTSGQLNEAHDTFRAALSLLTQVALEHPEVDDYRQELVRTCWFMVDHRPKAQEQATRSDTEFSLDDFYERLVPLYLALANGLRRSVELDASIKVSEAAIAILECQAQKFPYDPRHSHFLGWTIYGNALKHEVAGNLNEAYNCFKAASVWHQSALAVDPTNAEPRQFLAQTLAAKVRVARGLNLISEADQALEEIDRLAMAVSWSLPIQAEDSEGSKELFVSHEGDISRFFEKADWLLSANLQAEALIEFQHALVMQEALVLTHPNHFRIAANLGNLHFCIARIHQANAERSESIWELYATIRVWEPLARKEPTALMLAQRLGEVHLLLARSLGTLVPDEAESSYQRALELLQPPADQAEAIDKLIPLVSIHDSLGDLLVHQERIQEALEHFKRALPLAKKLIAQNPPNLEFHGLLSSLYNRIGVIHGSCDEPGQALAAFKHALKTQLKLMTLHPGTPETRWQLAGLYNNIGLTHKKLGHNSAALHAYQTAHGILKEMAKTETTGTMTDLQAQVEYLKSIIDSLQNPDSEDVEESTDD